MFRSRSARADLLRWWVAAGAASRRCFIWRALLIFPTTGHVRLDGVATDQLNEAGLTKLRREKIGFVFQSFQLLNTLSVVENVEVPLLLAGEANARPRAMERLADVGLAELAHRMTHQLSGGQMQRVAIARALVHGPRLILADEPTGNLDTATGNAILELLQRVCAEQQVTILMATHSAEAAAVADTIVRMRDGRSWKSGSEMGRLGSSLSADPTASVPPARTCAGDPLCRGAGRCRRGCHRSGGRCRGRLLPFVHGNAGREG